MDIDEDSGKIHYEKLCIHIHTNNIFNSCLFTAVDEDFQDGDTDSDVEEEFDENYAGGATSSEDD